MSSPSESLAAHPLLVCAQVIETALEGAADTPAACMPPAAKREALLRLARLEAQLTALRLRVMAVADDVARTEGARDAAALLTHHALGDAQANRRDLHLAEALDRRWQLLERALGRGEANVAQSLVIARALDEVPEQKVTAEVLREAEAHLVAQAAHFGPRELRVLGRRILDIVAPEVGERHEAEQLAEEERQARRRVSLTSVRSGDGSTRIMINVPDAVATRLHTYLEALTSPRHAGMGEADRIPADRRRGQAFCALLEAFDPQRLPVHGGDATTLIVTVPLAELRRELGVAELGPDDLLSASEVRRLACLARIIPAVLDGQSEVLDLGRSTRLFKPAQRKAMVVRDRECRGEGCSVPAAWCEAHHAGRPWAQGGRTDLRDGLLLCSWHHHRAHDPTFESERLADGDVRFRRRRTG